MKIKNLHSILKQSYKDIYGTEFVLRNLLWKKLWKIKICLMIDATNHIYLCEIESHHVNAVLLLIIHVHNQVHDNKI